MGGGVAQMVERSLSMREVPGSIPGASKLIFMLLASNEKKYSLRKVHWMICYSRQFFKN